MTRVGAERRAATQDDRGSVTAEFAAALPAALLVLLLLLGAFRAGTQLVRAQAVASQVARSIGRGDDAAVARLGARLLPGARVTTRRSGGLDCADVDDPVGLWQASAVVITVHATACGAIEQ